LSLQIYRLLGYVKVFVSIVCDVNKEGKQPKCERVQRKLGAIKGVKEVYYVGKNKSMDVVAFAHWKESEIASKIEEIKKIQGVSDVKTTIIEPVK
jgi:ACT domain-containing protein